MKIEDITSDDILMHENQHAENKIFQEDSYLQNDEYLDELNKYMYDFTVPLKKYLDIPHKEPSKNMYEI